MSMAPSLADDSERVGKLVESAQRILVFVDPETREVAIDFPLPRGGELKPTLNDDKKAVLNFSKATQEQKAHHVFWSNGMSNQLESLIEEGKKGAGLRLTLQWLINMRVRKTFELTQWRYQLVLISDRATWEALRKKT